MEFLNQGVTDLYTQSITYSERLNKQRFKQEIVFSVCNVGETQLCNIVEDILHIDELKVFHSFRYEKRRLSYALGRFTAKRALKTIIDMSEQNIYITYGCFHQPIIAKPICNVETSISHIDHVAFAVVSSIGCPVGVDVEKVQGRDIVHLKSFLINNEIKYASDHVLLTVMWSAKEAISKCLKIGLTSPFELFEIIDIKWCDGFFTVSFLNFPQFLCHSFTVGDIIFSFALSSQIAVDIQALKREILKVL